MKKILSSLFLVALATPSVASAQTLATYLVLFGQFLNTYVIGLIAAIGLFFFFWGLTKYWIMGASNEESRDKGKQLALWGILAFVFMLSLWGISTALMDSFGFTGGRIICPDYYPNCGS